MIVYAVCFEGASSSSSGCELSDMVREVAPYVTVHTLEIASTRKLKKRLMAALDWCAPSDRVVFVGKSLGAVRMFRILGDMYPYSKTCAKLGIPPDAIVSIDPLNLLRLIYPYDVHVEHVVASRAVNVYSRGAKVRGADNRKVDSSHMEIVRSGAAKVAVKEAVRWCNGMEEVKDESRNK